MKFKKLFLLIPLSFLIYGCTDEEVVEDIPEETIKKEVVEDNKEVEEKKEYVIKREIKPYSEEQKLLISYMGFANEFFNYYISTKYDGFSESLSLVNSGVENDHRFLAFVGYNGLKNEWRVYEVNDKGVYIIHRTTYEEGRDTDVQELLDVTPTEYEPVLELPLEKGAVFGTKVIEDTQNIYWNKNTHKTIVVKDIKTGIINYYAPDIGLIRMTYNLNKEQKELLQAPSYYFYGDRYIEKKK